MRRRLIVEYITRSSCWVVVWKYNFVRRGSVRSLGGRGCKTSRVVTTEHETKRQDYSVVADILPFYEEHHGHITVGYVIMLQNKICAIVTKWDNVHYFMLIQDRTRFVPDVRTWRDELFPWLWLVGRLWSASVQHEPWLLVISRLGFRRGLSHQTRTVYQLECHIRHVMGNIPPDFLCKTILKVCGQWSVLMPMYNFSFAQKLYHSKIPTDSRFTVIN